MSQAIIRLTESDLKGLISTMVTKMLREEIEGQITLQDIAQAIIDEVGDNYGVSPSGEDSFDQLNVNGNTVDVTFTYSVNIYKTPGKEYGYYDLPDEPEVVQEDTPDIDEVFIRVNLGEDELEDDGTVSSTIQDLFDTQKLYVDTSDSDAFLSQGDYNYEEF